MSPKVDMRSLIACVHLLCGTRLKEVYIPDGSRAPYSYVMSRMC